MPPNPTPASAGSNKGRNNQATSQAFIKPIDPPGPEVWLQYNPSKYTVARSVEWTPKQQKGVNVPAMDFVKGQGRTVTMELFVDGLEDDKDVSKVYVEPLQKLMEVVEANKKASNKPRPPTVAFHWPSKEQLFPAVLKSLNVTYTVFHPDGRPARATVSLTLQEIGKKKSGQNPSSLGDAGVRRHTVVAGETLDLIAFHELGSPTHWRYIAELNRIDNPFDLRPGQQLAIAPLP